MQRTEIHCGWSGQSQVLRRDIELAHSWRMQKTMCNILAKEIIECNSNYLVYLICI